ncbi:maleylpyruvate isomerase family mycothiol-dependent enzyme [Pseudonocardia abyssalis]|uniref:Maleylpyruvate isomerase family mycothiol-dependent enzyme n=1 Tax=Pseudonocardia abyssalis TaxID=2792008 RepID=A0ABS6UL39_9PSEU|nr:maleylpyruvate isomerase family mycothiol-dependent enzyme [Pseudonocardia abyssalis]MBW0114911.1 maleylpyruvate isomerase family mycothiol-dependent enzyme [Pseudonocardia abyssalis]MBW0132887.1 maleylpyruvate isomerase family mycothiol-dependent enzyme [Pseudonocardia abyssalis]
MDHAAALVEQNRSLAETVRDAPSDTPVPTCPGWTLQQLVRHVGRGDRWAATIVRTGAFVDPREVAGGKPGDDVTGWLHESPRTLLDAVADVGPDVPVWTFLGPRPAVWWIRRRLHESTVHRADAALALGLPFVIEPALAADGLSEWIALVAARPASELPGPLEPGTSMHLHATDDGLGEAGEWMVTAGEDGTLAWEHGHAKGAVAVRGTAADLLLALTRRIPPSAVEVLGDAAVLDTWLERTAF